MCERQKEEFEEIKKKTQNKQKNNYSIENSETAFQLSKNILSQQISIQNLKEEIVALSQEEEIFMEKVKKIIKIKVKILFFFKILLKI